MQSCHVYLPCSLLGIYLILPVISYAGEFPYVSPLGAVRAANIIEDADVVSVTTPYNRHENASTLTLNKPDSFEEVAVVSNPPLLLPERAILTENVSGELETFIEKYIIKKEKIPESTLRKILRYVAKAGAISFGTASGLPFFDVGYKAGGTNPVMQHISGISSTVAVSSAILWCSLSLVEPLNSVSDVEKAILKQKELPIAAKVVAHAIGLLGSMPMGYATYNYNSIRYFFILGAASDYFYISTGCMDLFEAIRLGVSKFRKLPPEQIEENEKMEKLNREFISPLENKVLKGFYAMSADEQEATFSRLYESNKQTLEYLSEIMKIRDTENPEGKSLFPFLTQIGPYFRNFIVYGSTLFPLLNFIYNGSLSYEGWMLLTESSLFSILISLFTASAICALEMRVMKGSIEGAWNRFYDKLNGTKKPDLLNEIGPQFKILSALVSIGLGTAFGNMHRFIALDTLDEFLPYNLAYAYSLIPCLVYTIFALNSTLEILGGYYTMSVKCCGSTSNKNKIFFTDAIKKTLNICRLSKHEKNIALFNKWILSNPETC